MKKLNDKLTVVETQALNKSPKQSPLKIEIQGISKDHLKDISHFR